MLLPALAILLFVLFLPLGRIVGLSFTDAGLLNLATPNWSGLANFHRLFGDPVFWNSLRITLAWTAGNVVVAGTLALIVAIALDRPFRGRNLLRALAIAPWAVPPVVVGLLFVYLFNSEVGIINHVLEGLGIIGQPVAWFSNTSTALPSVMVTAIWRQLPFHLLVYVAALKGVPFELLDAASIDGAGAWNRFRHVTWPYIRRYVVIAWTFMVAWDFNSFDLIWATTQGGPARGTNTLAVNVYTTMFQGLDVGYASAMGVVWLAILLPLGAFFAWQSEMGRRAG